MGIIQGMSSANERQSYNIIPPLIGWAYTQNNPCILLTCRAPLSIRWVSILISEPARSNSNTLTWPSSNSHDSSSSRLHRLVTWERIWWFRARQWYMISIADAFEITQSYTKPKNITITEFTLLLAFQQNVNFGVKMLKWISAFSQFCYFLFWILENHTRKLLQFEWYFWQNRTWIYSKI